jgi:hypothetical protein
MPYIENSGFLLFVNVQKFFLLSDLKEIFRFSCLRLFVLVCGDTLTRVSLGVSLVLYELRFLWLAQTSSATKN